MSSHEFTLILDHAPSGEELDVLFEAGCDDSTPETMASNGWLHFDRDPQYSPPGADLRHP